MANDPPLPRKKPGDAKRAAMDMINDEFMAFLRPVLMKDPVASFGADPDRVTQMKERLNVFGAYAPAAETVSRHRILREHVEGRPDLAGGDAVFLGATGQPYSDGGATVAHEFFHRGMAKLRAAGFVPRGTLAAVGGRRLNEEDVVRLVDWYIGRDKSGALHYFGKEHAWSEDDLRKVWAAPEVQGLFEKMFDGITSLRGAGKTVLERP